MKSTDAMLLDLIEREGPFVDNPLDRGGPTKFGITLKTLIEVRGPLTTVLDLKALTIREAIDIYENEYLVKPGFDKIAFDDLKELVFDTGVNHGRARSSRWLQESVNALNPEKRLKVDGILGRISIAAINSVPTNPLYCEFLARRYLGYAEFVRSDPRQAVFIVGWTNRANHFLRLI
jgi:lysozyme family protein